MLHSSLKKIKNTVTKVFLDANIILDFLNGERKGHGISREVIGFLTVNGIPITITEDLLTTIYYVTGNKRSMLEFLNFIVDEWEILPFGKDRIKEAVNICLGKKVDFEDVLQSLSARDANCDLIISNDRKFYDCGVRILKTMDFMELYGKT